MRCDSCEYTYMLNDDVAYLLAGKGCGGFPPYRLHPTLANVDLRLCVEY